MPVSGSTATTAGMGRAGEHAGVHLGLVAFGDFEAPGVDVAGKPVVARAPGRSQSLLRPSDHFFGDGNRFPILALLDGAADIG